MKKNHLIILASILTFISYCGGTAFAFGFDMPLPEDMSRGFLNQIFGSLLDGGDDLYGNAILMFNAGILIIGGILATYTILAGTLGTAHDGEMLGKKFSSVWIPIRYALGTALILPILPGGYCIIQGIVMWCIMNGVSFANGVWGVYMANPPALSVKMSSQPSDALIKFVEDTYLMNVCVEGNQKLREGGFNSISDVAYNLFFEDNDKKWEAKQYDKFGKLLENPVDPRANKYIQFGINQGIVSSYNCGEIHYMQVKADNNTATDNTISDSTKNTEYTLQAINEVKTTFKSPDYSPIIIEHYNQIDLVVEKTKALAKKNIGKNKKINPDEYNEIYKLAQEYNNAIKAKAKEVTTLHNLKKSSAEQGWFMAGAWITQIILHQNKLNTAINATPQITKFNFGTERQAKAEEFQKSVAGAVGLVATNNERARNYLTQENKQEEKDGKKKNPNPNISAEGDIAIYLAKITSGLDLHSIKDDNRHPIIIMSTVGNAILTSIMQAITFIFGAAVVASIWAGFSSMFITFFGTFAIPLAGFIGVGATLAYLIPNLPFILWVGIIIGWTIMCVEAIIVAPLWAVMHLHPNGDDVTGKGGSGYMLLLGLTLRPVLIIFGLISAITLSGLFGNLINAIFLDVFLMNQGDGGMGFFAALFGTALYATLMMIVIKSTFNLMHIIPDQILRWIGGGKEQLGQYAGASIESMAKASMVGATSTALATGSAFKGTGGIANEVEKAKNAKLKANERKLNNGSMEQELNSSNSKPPKNDYHSVKQSIKDKYGNK